MIIRIFLFSLVVLILTFNTSCLKKQNLEEEDLGPSFEAAELTKAMGTAFGSYNFSDIKPNEFSSYVLTQKIQDSFMQTLEQQDMLIENSVNSSDRLTLDMNVTKLKYSGGQSSQSTRKWNKVFYKGDGSSAGQQSGQANSSAQEVDEPTFMFLIFQSLAFGSCVTEGDYPESCYRLTNTDIDYEVPPSAAVQHGCGIEDVCTIKAKKIEFDMIRNYQLDKDGKPKRTHYTLIISKEVPFLSRVLQFCSRGLYEMSSSNQKILADLCYDINNYAFGN
jgi:hypothetical protein